MRAEEVEAQRVDEEHDSSFVRRCDNTCTVIAGSGVGERQASEEEATGVEVYSSKMNEEEPEEYREAFGRHGRMRSARRCDGSKARGLSRHLSRVSRCANATSISSAPIRSASSTRT